MSDKSRQPQKNMKNRNNLSSSSSYTYSNYTKSHYPICPNPSNQNSCSSSRITYSRNTTSSSCDNDDSRGNDNNDGNQDIPTIVGSCPFMCPVEERARRERLRDLAVFERLHGDPAKTSPSLVVKKFCRIINPRDMQASDVRSVPVLQDTLNHLLSLLQSSDLPFEVVHDFIFDRTRSIRQDLSLQNVVSDQVIHMYERMVKFHIISYYNFHRSFANPNTASMCHLNVEQLMKALTTLFNLYDAYRAAAHSVSQNEAEFYSFYLLLHLGSHNRGEPLSLWFRGIPSAIMNSMEICFARGVLRYYRMGNYKRFIYATEEEASFLQYCLLEPYIIEARILALSCISYGGYKVQPYPLVSLSKLLMMKILTDGNPGDENSLKNKLKNVIQVVREKLLATNGVQAIAEELIAIAIKCHSYKREDRPTLSDMLTVLWKY